MTLRYSLSGGSPLEALECDYAIIGGGSAGCVLANRLSTNPTVRVALIEAGIDPAAPELVERIADPGFRTLFAPALYWPNAFADVTAASATGVPGRRGLTLIARGLGGGSAVNGMQAARGLARDYDEWRSLGVAGWSSAELLPYFNRVETDLDFRGPDHGDAGPVHIQRVPDSQWSALSIALRAVLEARGLARVADFNDLGSGDGVGPVPLNYGPGGRASASSAYLTEQIRQRPNLRLLTECYVTRLLFDGRRLIGVEFRSGSEIQVLRCANAVVCAGAVQSPAILQRSGVGPADILRDSGIPLISERSGVGKNLVTHPLLSISTHLRPAARRTAGIRPPCPMVVRYSSGHPGCHHADMFINVWERASGTLVDDPAGRHTANLMLQMNKCFSSGDVRLNPADPLGMPRIRFNLLADERDRARMTKGLVFVASLLREAPVAQLVDESFIAQTGRAPALALRMLQGRPGARMISSISSLILDGPAWLRRRILLELGSIFDPAEHDHSSLEPLVLDRVMVGSHPVGTCRMGAEGDPAAVTDSRCRVIGVAGVWVADASIFPTIMTGGTNLPVMMAAEKVAHMILEDRRQIHASEVRTGHLQSQGSLLK